MLAKILLSDENNLVFIGTTDGEQILKEAFELPLSNAENFVEFFHQGRGIRIGGLLPSRDAVVSAFSALSQALCWPHILETFILPNLPTDGLIFFEVPPGLTSTPLHYLPRILHDQDHRLWSSLAGGRSWAYRVVDPVGYDGGTTFDQYQNRMQTSLNLRSSVIYKGHAMSEKEDAILESTLGRLSLSVPLSVHAEDVFSNHYGEFSNHYGEVDVLVFFGHSRIKQNQLTICGYPAEQFADMCLKRKVKLVVLACCEAAVPHAIDATRSFVEAFAGVQMPVVAAHWKPNQDATGAFLIQLLPNILNQNAITLEEIAKAVCSAELASTPPQGFEPTGFSLFM